MRLSKQLIILIFAVLLAACGGGGDTAASSDNDSTLDNPNTTETEVVWDSSNWGQANWK